MVVHCYRSRDASTLVWFAVVGVLVVSRSTRLFIFQPPTLLECLGGRGVGRHCRIARTALSLAHTHIHPIYCNLSLSSLQDSARPYYCWHGTHRPGGYGVAQYVADNPSIAAGRRVVDFAAGCVRLPACLCVLSRTRTYTHTHARARALSLSLSIFFSPPFFLFTFSRRENDRAGYC